MLKKLTIVLVVLFLAVAAAAALALANINSVVQRYHGELEQYAGQALGAPVHIDTLTTSIVPAARIIAKGFSFGKRKDKVVLGDLVVHLELLPLLSKKVVITMIELRKPELTVIKDSSGIRLAGLPRTHPAKPPVQPPVHPQAAQSPAPPQSPALPQGFEVNLQSFQINGGSVRLVDKTTSAATELSAVQIDASLAAAGEMLRLPAVQLNARLEGRDPIAVSAKNASFNLRGKRFEAEQVQVETAGSEIRTSVWFDAAQQRGETSSVRGSLDLAQLSALASRFLPSLSGYHLSGRAVPQLSAAFGQGMPPAINGEVALSALGCSLPGHELKEIGGQLRVYATDGRQQVEAADLHGVWNGARFTAAPKLALTHESVRLEDLAIQAFSGSVHAQGAYSFQTPRPFDAKGSLQTLRVEELFAAAKPGSAAPLRGTLRKAEFGAAGSAGALLQTLKGQFRGELVDGEIPQINVAKKVLEQVSTLPSLQGALLEKVPPEFQSALDAEGTRIKSLNAAASMQGSSVTIQQLHLVSGIFELKGNGSYEPSQGLSMHAEIIFSAQFSSALAARVKEIEYVLDADKRLVIPLKISGAPPAVQVIPDLKRLLQIGGQGKLKDTAAGAIDKALEKKGIKGLGNLLRSF